jgi:hypothetical protein
MRRDQIPVRDVTSSMSPNAVDSFVRMLHAIDAKDWNGVRVEFADEVDTDYTSLFGAPAARVRADDLVAGWRLFASPFDATQHFIGPFVTATPQPNQVIAETHVRAYHRIAGLPGGDVWMVAGHYAVQLEEMNGAWKIAGITLRVFYQEGNLRIPELARSAG